MHLTNFTFGRHKIEALGFQTYTYDEAAVATPPALGTVNSSNDDISSSRTEVIYSVIPLNSGTIISLANDTPAESLQSTLSLDGDVGGEPEVRLTPFHKPILGFYEVKCLCPASGRRVLHGTYGPYYFFSVNDFFC
jgi:hypothetical protein